MATIAELMVKDVLTVEPSDSIGEAAEKMHAADVGAVVVTDFGRIVGIVTERDLLRAVAQRARAAEARCRQWMTPIRSRSSRTRRSRRRPRSCSTTTSATCPS
jgi:CBS-domain-containing membrane protein